MNFLAHAYLSFDRPKVLVGNFIGDFVRGELNKQFEKEIVIGILLHREIDAYTDGHPLVKQAQELLKPEFHRYSLVITDMYYDHFLSRNWNTYNDKNIKAYTRWVYQVIASHKPILPKRFLHSFKYMRRENWLAAYGELEGLQRSFTGLSYRTSFESGMEKAPEFLESHYAFFEDNFKHFFQDLILFSKEKLDQMEQNNGDL